MNAFLAAGSELMQWLRQELTCFDIDPNSVQSQPCPLVDSYLIDELGLPFYVLPEEVIKLVRVVEDLRGGEVMRESAVLLAVKVVYGKGKGQGEKGKDGNLPYHSW